MDGVLFLCETLANSGFSDSVINKIVDLLTFKPVFDDRALTKPVNSVYL